MERFEKKEKQKYEQKNTRKKTTITKTMEWGGVTKYKLKNGFKKKIRRHQGVNHLSVRSHGNF
jgi:hypothetical protein